MMGKQELDTQNDCSHTFDMCGIDHRRIGNIGLAVYRCWLCFVLIVCFVLCTSIRKDEIPVIKMFIRFAISCDGRTFILSMFIRWNYFGFIRNISIEYSRQGSWHTHTQTHANKRKNKHERQREQQWKKIICVSLLVILIRVLSGKCFAAKMVWLFVQPHAEMAMTMTINQPNCLLLISIAFNCFNFQLEIPNWLFSEWFLLRYWIFCSLRVPISPDESGKHELLYCAILKIFAIQENSVFDTLTSLQGLNTFWKRSAQFSLCFSPIRTFCSYVIH